MRPALALLFCCCALAPVSAEAQFLSRDTRGLWANEVFENYGAHGYRDYDFEEENRRFDFFGDLLIDGVDILEYSEVRRDAPGQIGSYEARSDGYRNFFQKLVIANEGFGSWSTRLIFGEHLRTVFTPMTLNLPNFNGIRWDGSSRKSRFSMIATHLRDPLVFDTAIQERRVFGTSLVGGHWESQVGDLLKIGTTYVNTHRFDAEASAKLNGFKGDVPGVIQEGGLRRVFVFFTDDAPHDRSPGATIYGLTMFADGEAVRELRVGKIDRILEHITVTADRSNTVPLNPTDVQYLRRNGPWLRAVVEASNTNFFPIVLGRITQPTAPASSRFPLVATGTDVVFYEYEVPEGARDVRFEAALANDYSIDVVGGMQVPLFDAGTDYGDIYYDWNNTLRARGTPGSDANVRQVSFRYGFPTGLGILGINFEAKILGSSLQGEYARSARFLKMPSAGGARHERRSSTFYVNFERPVTERAEIGFEWFDVPSDYTTEFSLFESSSLGFPVGGHTYNRFALVEDNDDLDAWPDWTEHGDPLGFFSRSTNQGYGVFPGLDLNQDGRLDLNVGGNAFTPFLGYYVDPPELVYGDDFNNNGIVDLRENDNLPDYLYPLDHQGLHAFVSIKPTTRSQLRLGSYRLDQPMLGPSSDGTYMEGEYKRAWEGIGDIRLVHRTKWLKDNIQNTVYQFVELETLPSGLTRPARYELQSDLLQHRDSVDNLTHIEADLKTVPDLNISNVLAFNHIDLSGPILDDPLAAAPGTITHFSMINKADYTWNWRKFQLISQFKHIYQRSKFPERKIANRQTRWIIPILRMEYPVGPNTTLKTGMQGLPFFAERSLDPTSPERDFHRRTYTAFLQNSSNHRGYDLTLLFGGYRSFTTFSGSERPSLGFVEYFFKIFIG
jgi:hypothetical protein